MKNSILAYTALAGETAAILAAALWLAQPAPARWAMAAGALLFCTGRLAGHAGDCARSADHSPRSSTALRRLYRQRIAGALLLALAAALMHAPAGFCPFGLYLRPSAWLLPFILFAVFETYTAFRIPAEEQKLAGGHPHTDNRQ